MAKAIVQIPVRMPPELWQRLDAEAILLKESRNSVVVMALEFFFQRHEPQTADF
jgi:predicted transcriptional regulator